MAHSKVFDNGLYYIVHLSEQEMLDIHTFKCREKSGFLESYLKLFALDDELNNKARTYLVRDMLTDELVAYFSLKAGFVSVNDRVGFFKRVFDSIPACELANFAVNKNYIEKHPEAKGIGKVVFSDFVEKVVVSAAEWIGIDIIYLFALPKKDLITRYKTYGFSRLSTLQERAIHKRIRPRYDGNCIFMFRQL